MTPHTAPTLPNPDTATLAELSALVSDAGIRHVAMIMDGNRRWAQQAGLPKMTGHAKGVDALKKIVRHCGDIGIEALTVYAFSTENWRRGEEEVGYLMKLFIQALSMEIDNLHANGVQLHFIGDLSPLPPDLTQLLHASMAKTAQNTGLKLQVATNYGSRAELIQAARTLAQEVQSGQLVPEDITEELMSQKLYTCGLPDPEILIRTGGDSRLSNYLLWQCAYTEFFVLDTLWPDFSAASLNRVLVDFVQRERRFGQ